MPGAIVRQCRHNERVNTATCNLKCSTQSLGGCTQWTSAAKSQQFCSASDHCLQV